MYKAWLSSSEALEKVYDHSEVIVGRQLLDIAQEAKRP